MAHCNRSDNSFQNLPPLRQVSTVQEITDHIVSRAMRRLVATGKAEDLAACVQFLGDVKDTAARRQALAGLVEAIKTPDR